MNRRQMIARLKAQGYTHMQTYFSQPVPLNDWDPYGIERDRAQTRDGWTPPKPWHGAQLGDGRVLDLVVDDRPWVMGRPGVEMVHYGLWTPLRIEEGGNQTP